MKYYLDAFRRYADFYGRSNRAEYWMFVLFNILFGFLAVVLDFALFRQPVGIIYLLYVLVTLIPSLAVAVRRLHDSGRSGWMLLIALIPFVGGIWLLVLMLADSEAEDNIYGIYASGSGDSYDPANYNPNVLDQEIQVNRRVEKRSEMLITIVVCWFLLSSVLWKLLSASGLFDLGSTAYIIWYSISILGSIAMPFLLAFAVQSKGRRTTLVVIASILTLLNLINGITTIQSVLAMDYINF